MRHYRSYMDRQEISAGGHGKLMNLTAPPKAVRHSWMRYGTLAACAALILGLGAWGLSAAPAPEGPYNPKPAPVSSSAPAQTEALATPRPDSAQPVEPPEGFVVSGPAGDKLAFPMIPYIRYQDMTEVPEIAAARRAFPPGSFTVELTRQDIQAIFWGAEGRLEADHPKTEQGDLPWMLFWEGYTVHGAAWYDGQGRLTDLTLWGERGRASFTLELRLGALPFTCCVDLSRGDQTSDVLGVPVAGWSRVYDRDGDGQADYICGSEFMTPNDIGVRFQSVNSAMEAEYEGGTAGADMALDGTCTFNALFVRQALAEDGGLHLDHLAFNENIPAWRDVTFDSLEQARQEAEFAPYLPAAEPEGYAAYAGNKDFFGRLSYQEGRQNMLFVRWTRGYDNVEIQVSFPEGESVPTETIDISRPETYDTRLYSIPWCDSVPEEYLSYFLSTPVFRAEDMSLDVVEARMIPRDTGGQCCDFSILYENGVVASYHCGGMTAQQVWVMAEGALAAQSSRRG